MIFDLKQPAKDWLADVMQNFGKQLDAGDDPSINITVNGVKMEIRLNELPGHFKREVKSL